MYSNGGRWKCWLIDIARTWGPELLILALGLWLRYRYAVHANMVEDEYFEALALTGIVRHGIPLLESGALHPRGWTFLYGAVPIVLALGPTKLAMRLVNVMFDAVLMALVVHIGRREGDRPVGLGGGLVVALLPTLIENTPRVRFYGPFVLFSLLAVWAALRACRRPAHTGPHVAFAAAFGLAIMAHEEALLLYPPLLGLVTLWGGRAYWRRRGTWGAHLAIAVVIVVRAGLEVLANWQAPAFLGVQGKAKPYLEPFVEVAEKWQVYWSIYAQQAYWPVMAAFVMALLLVVLSGWRRPGPARTWPLQSLTFFSVPFVWSLIVLVFLAGSTWRESRYMLFVEPMGALASAAGLWWMLEPAARFRFRRGLYVAWIVGAGAMLWPKAWDASSARNADYVSPFAHVAAERRPGDVVVTPLIQVCAFLLPGGCDYYAREDGYGPTLLTGTACWWTVGPGARC
ncbi:MAG: glycosyltransferase family 39 protein [Ardenticatenia bacterium]|nr:glycosyltransferase family 39 protein [Ardenticatenia bacterium]